MTPRTGKLRRLLSAAALCLCAGTPAMAYPIDYGIDQTTADIAFTTRVAGTVPVDGSFRSFDGHIRFDTTTPSEVHIDVLVDDSRIDVPFGGASTLRSKPYFDTPQFPTIRFHSDSVQALPGDQFQIAGMLTIRGVTRPQILTGTMTRKTVRGIPAMLFVFHSKLDRTTFGLIADQPLIAKQVTLTITATLRAP